MPIVTTESLPPLPDRVESTVQDHVLVLRLVNEGRANALTERMLDQLVRAMQGPDAQGARAAILTGDGERHFSSGAELGAEPAKDWIERVKRIEHGLQAVALAVTKAPFPVIAAINGDAIGGGLELAMACDWRIAREGTRFAMPPARIGLVYTAEGMRRFVAEIGLARARELFLTGRAFDARHALDIGLVNHVVGVEEVLPLATRMAAAVAANAPMAVEGMRVVLRAVADDDAAEAKAQQWRVRAFGSSDLAEGLAATRERRPPTFGGS
jgi:enoyl-CoA hydratase/carnithine racemase